MTQMQEWNKHLQDVLLWLRNAGFHVLSIDAETGVIVVKVKGAPDDQ